MTLRRFPKTRHTSQQATPQWKRIPGGVTAPQGFQAGGMACGIKRSGKPDLALIVSDRPAQAAGCFTQNFLRASCVDFSEQQLKRGVAQAIVANSGNANACTGKTGYRDTVTMAKTAAAALHLPFSRLLVSSTGSIGHPLPMKKLTAGIRSLATTLQRTPRGSTRAAKAILTTDKKVKELAFAVRHANGQTYCLGGIAKGSGMIHPNMATMLCYLTTDAKIPARTLRPILKRVVRETFNMISVEGDTSTNDSVILMANGASVCSLRTAQDLAHFEAALHALCETLAKAIVADGEGATKLFTVTVQGVKTTAAAKTIARTITTSPLVKTALFGGDPNWGRIMGAIGRAGPKVNPTRIDIALGGIPIARNGQSVPFSAAMVKRVLQKPEIDILVNLKSGKGSARAWGCDLTYGYVTINAKYHT